MPPERSSAKVALVTAAATFGTFGLSLFLVADVGRLRILRWSAALMIVVAAGIVVQLVRQTRNRRR